MQSKQAFIQNFYYFISLKYFIMCIAFVCILSTNMSWASAPKSGTWSGSAGFGEIEFIVTPNSGGINKITFYWSVFHCDGIIKSGLNMFVYSITPLPISNNQFDHIFELNFSSSEPVQSITIHGSFDSTGSNASGKYDYNVEGTICSGTWNASTGAAAAQVWYEDMDGDGYPNGTSVQSVSRFASDYYLASELKAISGDCDDNDPTIHPDANEICGDGKDNDCNGQTDEGCTQNITAPSSLSAKAISSTQIAIGWKDNSNNESGFKIERKTGDCGTNNPWTQITTKSTNATSHTVSGLSPNITYAFRVKTYNTSSDSTFSNCASAKTSLSGTPPAPSNLRATSATSSKINLNWNDNSTNETGFKIYRKTGSGAYALRATTAANVKAFSDTAATNNTSTITYQYYLVTYNDSGNSPTTYTAIVPYQPIDLIAEQGAADGTVNLIWTDRSSNESGFEIYRKSGDCSSSSTWIKVGTLEANKTTWTDTGRTSGTIYAYKIRAYKKSGSILPVYGYSSYSNCASAIAP